MKTEAGRMIDCIAASGSVRGTGCKNSDDISAGDDRHLREEVDGHGAVEEPAPMPTIMASSSDLPDVSVPCVENHSEVIPKEERSYEETNSIGEVRPEVELSDGEVSIGGSAVAEVRAKVDELSEKVSALHAVVYGGTAIDEKDMVYLAEMLMRQLLILDSIEAKGEGRLQRKLEVRRVQGFLEAIDTLKARNSTLIRVVQSQL